MANNLIIKMISRECRDQKVSQMKLCYGICSQPYLSRTIRENIEMDKLMLESLIQRLGISTRRYTFILRDREYDLFELRERTRKCIWNGELEHAESYIKEYIGKVDDLKSAKHLHLQVILLLHSYVLAQKRVPYEEQFQNVTEALAYTEVYLQELTFDKRLYCEVEMLLILRAAMILEKLGRVEEAVNIYESMYKLQKKSRYKNNEFSHVFAKVNYEVAKHYLQKGEFAKALEISEYGIKMLADGNKILYLWELMEIYLTAEENVMPAGEVNSKHEIYKNYKSIKYVVGEGYKNWNADEHCPMYYEYKIYSLRKMVTQRRKLRGETQESISIKSNCNLATIERLERGLHNTQNDIRYSLLNEVGLPIEKCYYMLITDNMQVKRDYFSVIEETEKGNLTRAKSILEGIKQKIDLSIAINRQAIELRELGISQLENKLSSGVELKMEERLLEWTLPLEYLTKKVSGLLYDNEESIVRRIIINLKRNDAVHKANDLTIRMVNGYKPPNVIEDEFVSVYLGFSRMLESTYANNGEFKKSDAIIEENINKCMQHDMAGMLVFFLYDYVWNKEKQEKAITSYDICLLDTVITIAALKDYQERLTHFISYKEKIIRRMKDRV